MLLHSTIPLLQRIVTRLLADIVEYQCGVSGAEEILVWEAAFGVQGCVEEAQGYGAGGGVDFDCGWLKL